MKSTGAESGFSVLCRVCTNPRCGELPYRQSASNRSFPQGMTSYICRSLHPIISEKKMPFKSVRSYISRRGISFLFVVFDGKFVNNEGHHANAWFTNDTRNSCLRGSHCIQYMVWFRSVDNSPERLRDNTGSAAHKNAHKKCVETLMHTWKQIFLCRRKEHNRVGVVQGYDGRSGSAIQVEIMRRHTS